MNIASTILRFFKDNGTDMSAVVALGCEGTAVNTGFKRESSKTSWGEHKTPSMDRMSATLQWFSLGHLINIIDGKITVPASLKDLIGSKLNDCDKFPIVEFEKIQSEELVVTTSDLSADQKYLLKIYTTATSVHCPDDVARVNPGKIHHTCRITTANRIPRLMCQKMNIVHYIIRVYISVWFQIKWKTSVLWIHEFS